MVNVLVIRGDAYCQTELHPSLPELWLFALTTQMFNDSFITWGKLFFNKNSCLNVSRFELDVFSSLRAYVGPPCGAFLFFSQGNKRNKSNNGVDLKQGEFILLSHAVCSYLIKFFLFCFVFKAMFFFNAVGFECLEDSFFLCITINQLKHKDRH